MLTLRDVTGILRLGGTILGTTNRGNPFAYPVQTGDGPVDYSDRCIENFKKMGLDALIVIGGDGTLTIAHEFHKRGIPIVGVPKTIDNDIVETTMTFGFDTAVAFATEAIDRLHTTAEAHHRVMVVEVMGRYAGWIALYAGIAGGADVVLIPEIPFDLDKVGRAHPGARATGRPLQHRRRRRRRVSRRAARTSSSRQDRPTASSGSAASASGSRSSWSADGEGNALRRARPPAARRRAARPTIACWRRGSAASPSSSCSDGKFGVMTALKSPDIVAVPLECVVGRTRNVPVDGDVVRTARNVGIAFGD